MTRAYLIVAGLIGTALGTMILFTPVAFYAGYDIDPTGQVNLLSELRSHGLAVVGAGLFMASGAFLPRFAIPAIFVSAGFYLSYGLSRLVAVALDGMPSNSLLLATGMEIVIGLVGLGLLYRSRRALAA